MSFSGVHKDYRFWCLVLALAAMLALFAHPRERQKQSVYNLTFIVDVTRSMNAQDYRLDDSPVSRLQYVKQTLRELLPKLPCQSKVGLGIFTERRSTLLFEPIEVCSGFAELDAVITELDWRIAWAADSRIAGGLLSALEILQNSDSKVVFVTDGQEAPPVNPRYRSDFSAIKGKLDGMILGVGGLQPVPIPKFNGKGEADGFYSAEDVPHRSSFGESNLNPEKIEGYDARNAPFGREAATGSEHLASLREPYLQQLASEAGLRYHRLTDIDALNEALQTPDFAVQKPVDADVRWKAAVAALALLLPIYGGLFKRYLNRAITRV
ncbi:vWA domain-containing protein [Methylobacter sp. BlB1]|uniref:vWA domain-containing protein n=1 Tax=Methylobacter sp. BlB1 TaxID=2785914 RepID=UPI001893B657|nr:vWA domain-containing protein [Methylobacter sp. BlB1]MBF6649819.1 VWA domain-containing protein [Methylobacter sp. BlB1]